jgi:hypothetical protein
MTHVGVAVLAPDPTLGDRLLEILNGVSAIWSFQLMSMDGRPLTVGKVVIAVAVLLVGAPIAKIFMRRFAHRVFTRIGFEHGAAASS